MKRKRWLAPSGLGLFLTLVPIACKDKSESVAQGPAPQTALRMEKSKKPLSGEFKKYWYDGEAEITSYALEQARYGELRKGEAVLIYVTEDFLPGVQVKAERKHPDNISVLKLNSTKTFLTGIYPYSIMESTFYPVGDNGHALKNSLSVQEWCGHVYSQINNRERFEFTSHSYFEGEADRSSTLDKAILESELWTKLRIDPRGLPQGEIQVVPSLEYLRLHHREPRAYRAQGDLSSRDGTHTYTLSYPELGRTLAIEFATHFPHGITGWWEENLQGHGEKARTMTSRATKIQSLKAAYWSRQGNGDLHLRDSLGL